MTDSRRTIRDRVSAFGAALLCSTSAFFGASFAYLWFKPWEMVSAVALKLDGLGNLGEWVAGIGAITAVGVAVGVAIYTSRKDDRRTSELRLIAAQAFAAGLHGELGAIAATVEMLLSDRFLEPLTPEQAEEIRVATLGHVSAPTLDRLIDRVDVFDPKTAGLLMIVYRGVSAIRQAAQRPGIGDPRIDFELKKQDLAMLSRTARGIQKALYSCIDRMTRYAGLAGIELSSAAEVKALASRLPAEAEQRLEGEAMRTHGFWVPNARWEYPQNVSFLFTRHD